MQITGNVGSVKYTVEQSVIDEAKEVRGIDIIAELENIIKKELENNPDDFHNGS